MLYNSKSNITTVEDVKQFFHYLVSDRKVNFHPDDDFGQYVSMQTGEPFFSKEEVPIYNRLMEEAFCVCENNGADIYEIGLQELQDALEVL